MYELPMTVGMVPNLGTAVAMPEHVVTVLGAVCLAITAALLVALLPRATRRSAIQSATDLDAREVGLSKAA